MAATRTWNGTTGNWGTPGNWSGNAVPQPGDIVILPPTKAVGGYTVTDSSTTAITLNSLTIGANDGGAGGTNKVTLVLAGANITTSGAVSIASYGTIEGTGSLNALGGFGVLASGNPSILAGTASSGGILDLAGPINSNIILGFANTTYATTLKLEGSQSLNGLTLATSTQTLELNAGSNVYFGGTISATGGMVKVDGAATLSASNITLLGSAELDVTGAVTVSTNFSVTNSTIKLIGSTLTANSGVTLAGTALLSGYGTLVGSITGKGTVSAVGGNLTLTGDVFGGTTNLVVGAGTTLALTTGGSGINVADLTFTNVSGQTDIFRAVNIGQNSLLIGKISSFDKGDYIDVKQFTAGDTVSLQGVKVTITAGPGGGGSQTYTFSSGDVAKAVVASSSITGLSGGAIRHNGAGVDELSLCFMAGTAIRTPEGEAPIETLKRGDLVLTADGEAKPVIWIGLQTIVSRFADPIRNWPIRIAAGALADNVPSRDLLVSPDHALLVDGILIHAGALVNGTSIRRESAVPEKFVYYHVELEDHSLILAENVPAESFVDNVDRRNFDNWAEHEALYPEGRAIDELPLPRAKAQRQVPVAIRVALGERAIVIQESAAA